VSADVSGLLGLAADLAAAATAVEVEGRAVVSRGALNVKNDWRANAAASGRTHAGRLYPLTISYDLATLPGGGTKAEVGPDRAKDNLQASFGAILEFGSVHNPPHNDGGRALLAEEPRFVAAVEAMADRLSP
jgi:hypothetical protein